MYRDMPSLAIFDALLSWQLRWQVQLQQRLQRRALRRACGRAYARFALMHSHAAESLFDMYFLEHHAAPLLARCLQPGGSVRPDELARAWLAQFKPNDELPRRVLRQELVATAEAFLHVLDEELGRFQPASVLKDSSKEATTAVQQGHMLPTGAAKVDAAWSNMRFAEALRENSNREMDWLWLASQLACPVERRYCLERALQINPDSSYTSLVDI